MMKPAFTFAEKPYNRLQMVEDFGLSQSRFCFENNCG